jgi:sporulation related protein
VSAQPAQSVGDAYEAAGRRAAVALRGYSSAVVVADNASDAARVALGMARSEAAYRRVVIGDLTTDSPEIQALAPVDDALGIYDSFTFGTSLKKVTRQVPGAANLNVLLAGTESVATSEIMGSARWQRIASEFARSDEMLILVAEELAPSLATLVSRMDGVVLVGNSRIPRAPEVNVLARVPPPLEGAAPAVAVESAEELPLWRRPPIIIAAASALVLLIAATMLSRRGSSEAARTVPAALSGSVSDSASESREMSVAPVNPADSAAAAAFAVEILAANTQEGANFELQRHGAMMPAATISVVPIGETEAIWYKVYAGAYRDSADAERLLRSLRRRGVVSASSGVVARAPLALRVDSVPAQGGVFARAREKVRGYSSKGLAVYALMQEDGSARLYSGAFASPSQTSLAATALRVAGLTPVLEYRTGRSQ